ncbi:MAG: FAD-dependent monooxygenase [Betaproteobacteria bacterium]|nr:FAD-dependent monooxygenase [Betaproteobacteria bacterium]
MSGVAEIVVVGGGPVGLSFALSATSLVNAHVTVIDRENVPAVPAPGKFDHRVYALSPASMRFLQSLGVWPNIDRARTAAVDAMEVFGDDDGALHFRHAASLACIVEHSALMRALHAAADVAGERLSRRQGAALAALDCSGPQPQARLDNGETIAADLLVGADGARSRVRESAAIGVDDKDYQSDALVANFHCEQAHRHVARQWFLADSVLAWLPMPEGQISLVWSVERQRADALVALDQGAFAAAVAEAGGNRLGRLTMASPLARFPLRRQIAHHWSQSSLVLIGDAAHAIHPLAGQGVNLGFGDAETLSTTLRERSRLSGVGDPALLRRYERARREQVFAMGEATDRLRSLYLQASPAARRIRNAGLSTVDRLPFLKRAFMAYAMN